MKRNEVYALAKRIMDEQVESNGSAPLPWVVTAILGRFPDLLGKDRDFYLLAGSELAKSAARDAFRNRDKPDEDEDDPQTVLPGFCKVRKAYTVDRDGVQTYVRIELMTPAERRAKAGQYRKMGAACYAHADELDEYEDKLAAGTAPGAPC